MQRRIFPSWIAIALSFLLAALVATPAVAGDTSQTKEASLYERLGGVKGISVVVSDFIDVMVPDPVLNQNPAIDAARKRVPPAYLKYHVTAMVCEATGGPCEYHGRDMESSHAHLNITEKEWDRMVTLLQQVLNEHEVPEAESEELMAILGSTKPAIVTQTGS